MALGSAGPRPLKMKKGECGEVVFEEFCIARVRCVTVFSSRSFVCRNKTVFMYQIIYVYSLYVFICSFLYRKKSVIIMCSIIIIYIFVCACVHVCHEQYVTRSSHNGISARPSVLISST